MSCSRRLMTNETKTVTEKEKLREARLLQTADLLASIRLKPENLLCYIKKDL